MWKKEEAQKRADADSDTAVSQARQAPKRTQGERAPGERATIGRSITIQGEVTGDEDLMIQGRIEGSVHLKQHSVTVGPEGEVTANISGRVVTVEGHVEGDLRAEEQVVLRESARVEGDISAPRVTLEDGAYFRGGVDMGETGGKEQTSGSRGSATAAGKSASKSETGSTASAATGASAEKGTPTESSTGAGHRAG